MACHLVDVIGLDAAGAALLDRLLFFGQKFQLQGLDDGLGNFIL